MEWLKANALQLLLLVLLVYAIYQQYKIIDLVDDARNEASFTNQKLDIVESDINSKK
ncbi:MAG: hypothetical protein SNJ77_11150 [Cytophagales bacterium]